jgi:SAM-dependent methyltransferase
MVWLAAVRPRPKEAIMGFYADRVVPHIVNVACSGKTMAPMRTRVCAGLHGDVVEIGFGSGHNVPHYPRDVAKVAAVEPADVGWRLADKRIRESSVLIERSGLDGQSLPFADHSYDAALTTWTLCTVPDAAVVLAELRRVLKPGGALHFAEHGLAPDEDVRRWQRRLDPLEVRAFGGCHLTRPIADMVTDAGFTIIELEEFYQKGAPKFGGAQSIGVATSP